MLLLTKLFSILNYLDLRPLILILMSPQIPQQVQSHYKRLIPMAQIHIHMPQIKHLLILTMTTFLTNLPMIQILK